MRYSAVLWFCLIAGSFAPANAQPAESMQASGFTFHLARVLLKDGRARMGWFLGTARDTLLIQVGVTTERFSRRELLRVTVDSKPERMRPALIGAITAAYAGNVIFLSADDGPTLFQSGETCDAGKILATAGFALCGGLVGVLVGAAHSDEELFDFSGNDEEASACWDELRRSGTESEAPTSLHLLVQGSWVSGPLSFPDDGNSNVHAYDRGGSLNLLRRVQLTYSVTGLLGVGIAEIWLGQPSITYYTPSPDYKTGKVGMTGNGFYAVGSIQPLWKLGWRGVKWRVGGGVGLASIDLKSHWSTYSYPASVEGTEVVSKRYFSAMVNTTLELSVARNFSLGLTAELVTIPEALPVIEGVAFPSNTLGTSSVGFVLGFHL